jgi:hypothetical protein
MLPSVLTNCICQSKLGPLCDLPSIFCDRPGCENAFHPECLGMQDILPEWTRVFICRECLGQPDDYISESYHSQWIRQRALDRNDLHDNTIPEPESSSELDEPDTSLDVFDVSDDETSASDTAADECNSSESIGNDDMGASPGVATMGMTQRSAENAVETSHGDTKTIVQSICSSDSCSKSVEIREKLRRHTLSCPYSATRPIALKPNSLYLDHLEALGEHCEQCSARFSLRITLEIHIRAKHGQRDQACEAKRCPASQRRTLFNKWQLSIHNKLCHDWKSFRCPLPSCPVQGDL